MGHVFDADLGQITDSALWSRMQSQGAAALASPTFTGTPAAPTAAAATNTTQVATTAFVLANAATQWTSTAAGSLSAAGSTRTDATAIAALNKAIIFTTVGSGQGAVLPATAANQWAFVQNNQGSNALKLYANGSETINGTAGSTGISIPANKSALLFVPAAGVIFAIISA